MCDFRGTPTKLYLIKEDRFILISGSTPHDPKVDTMNEPGMYHTINVTGCGNFYYDGTRILEEYNGYYPNKEADYVPIYNTVQYWGMGSEEEKKEPKFMKKIRKHLGAFQWGDQDES